MLCAPHYGPQYLISLINCLPAVARVNGEISSSPNLSQVLFILPLFCLLECQQCCIINRVFILELEVREQERHIALQVRRDVQERKERELQSLATALRDQWQQQRGERIQTLEKLYKENLGDVGQGQRDARLNVSGIRAKSVVLKSVVFMSSSSSRLCHVGFITCDAWVEVKYGFRLVTWDAHYLRKLYQWV